MFSMEIAKQLRELGGRRPQGFNEQVTLSWSDNDLSEIAIKIKPKEGLYAEKTARFNYSAANGSIYCTDEPPLPHPNINSRNGRLCIHFDEKCPSLSMALNGILMLMFKPEYDDGFHEHLTDSQIVAALKEWRPRK